MLRAIIRFLFYTPPASHPYKVAEIPAFDDQANDDLPVDIKNETWGKYDEKLVKRQTKDDGFEVDVVDKTAGRLPPVPLDNFDVDICRERQLNQNNYKLVKPYVLARRPKWTNKQAATALGVSLRFVETVSKSIKDADRIRRSSNVKTSTL
jgi:hypothetical protein